MKIGITLIFLTLGLSSASSFGAYEKGISVGGGIFGASSDDCEYSGCSYSGQYIELGYDINNIASVELKYGNGKSSYSTGDSDLSLSYVGVNAGHNFGTTWFNLYGKAGIAQIKEDESDNYSKYTETAPTGGIGVRFFLAEDSKGFYAKLETIAVSFQNESTGYSYVAGIGYKF